MGHISLPCLKQSYTKALLLLFALLDRSWLDTLHIPGFLQQGWPQLWTDPCSTTAPGSPQSHTRAAALLGAVWAGQGCTQQHSQGTVCHALCATVSPVLVASRSPGAPCWQVVQGARGIQPCHRQHSRFPACRSSQAFGSLALRSPLELLIFSITRPPILQQSICLVVQFQDHAFCQ